MQREIAAAARVPSRLVLSGRRDVADGNDGLWLAGHPVQLRLHVSQTRLLPLGGEERDKRVTSCSVCLAHRERGWSTWRWVLTMMPIWLNTRAKQAG